MSSSPTRTYSSRGVASSEKPRKKSRLALAEELLRLSERAGRKKAQARIGSFLREKAFACVDEDARTLLEILADRVECGAYPGGVP